MNNMMPRPSISVVIIGRNEGQRLARCLESVLRMPGFKVGATELIYVDSASKDGSPDLAARYSARVIVLDAPRTTAAMGRNAGWVALATGLAGGADATLVPEEPYDEAALLERVRRAVAARGHAVLVVSEGIDLGTAKGSAGGKDEFGHELLRERGVGAELARRLEKALGLEVRSAQIGHIQRGGPPTLFDRLLATRLGAKAVDLAIAGRFGEVAVLRGERVEGVPFDACLTAPKVVGAEWTDLLHTFES